MLGLHDERDRGHDRSAEGQALQVLQSPEVATLRATQLRSASVVALARRVKPAAHGLTEMQEVRHTPAEAPAPRKRELVHRADKNRAASRSSCGTCCSPA